MSDTTVVETTEGGRQAGSSSRRREEGGVISIIKSKSLKSEILQDLHPEVKYPV